MSRTGQRKAGKPRTSVSPAQADLTQLQRYILDYLRQVDASYAHPVPSAELARYFNITDSYAREQTRPLVLHNLVAVRGGPKGGYYLAGRPSHVPMESSPPAP